MKSEDLIELLEERPFVPSRMHLSNGRTHEIRHSEMAIVGQNVVALDVGGENNGLPRIRLVSVAHITEVEPLSDKTRIEA